MQTVFQVLTLAWSFSGGLYSNEAINDQGLFTTASPYFLDAEFSLEIPFTLTKGAPDFAFIGAENEDQFTPDGWTNAPYRETYTTKAGVHLFGVDAGYEHQCMHPLFSAPTGLSNQITESFDKFYIKVTGKI